MAAGLASTPVLAQRPLARPERPSRALFGGGVGATEQLLKVDFMLGAGYDDDLSAEATGSAGTELPARERASGTFGSLSGSISYAWNKELFKLNTSVSLDSRYYPHQARNFLSSYGAAVGGAYTPSERTSFSFNQTFSYLPYYSQAFFPPVYDTELGNVLLIPPTIAEQREEYFVSGTDLQFARGLSARTNLMAGYGYHTTTFSVRPDFTDQTAMIAISHAIGRGLALRGGYSVTDAQYRTPGSPDHVRNGAFNGGLDFNRALSLTRRTRLQFNTGLAVTGNEAGNQYNVIGDAKLTREIGRTWHAGAAYSRSVQLSAFYPEPVLSDSAMFSYGGMVNRRVQCSASAGLSSGTVGVSVGDNSLLSLTAGGAVQVGLTRNLGLTVNYTYYRHTYGDAIVLPPGALRQFDRQSVSAQLAVWAPLMQRRRANASR